MGYPTADRNAFLDAQITGALDVALFTTAPDDDGTGGVEVSGGGYARVSHSAWTSAANGLKSNSGEIDFGDPTADWGTVVAIAVFSGATQKAVTSNISQAIVSSVNSVKILDGALEFDFLTP